MDFLLFFFKAEEEKISTRVFKHYARDGNFILLRRKAGERPTEGRKERGRQTERQKERRRQREEQNILNYWVEYICLYRHIVLQDNTTKLGCKHK